MSREGASGPVCLNGDGISKLVVGTILRTILSEGYTSRPHHCPRIILNYIILYCDILYVVIYCLYTNPARAAAYRSRAARPANSRPEEAPANSAPFFSLEDLEVFVELPEAVAL